MMLTDAQIDAFCSKQAGSINRDRDRRKRETHRALLQAIRIDRELDKAMVAFEQEIAEWLEKGA